MANLCVWGAMNENRVVCPGMIFTASPFPSPLVPRMLSMLLIKNICAFAAAGHGPVVKQAWGVGLPGTFRGPPSAHIFSFQRRALASFIYYGLVINHGGRIDCAPPPPTPCPP